MNYHLTVPCIILVEENQNGVSTVCVWALKPLRDKVQRDAGISKSNRADQHATVWCMQLLSTLKILDTSSLISEKPVTSSLCSMTRTEPSLSELYSRLVIPQKYQRNQHLVLQTEQRQSWYMSFALLTPTSQSLHSFYCFTAQVCTILPHANP